jgi:hypothetical protein
MPFDVEAFKKEQREIYRSANLERFRQHCMKYEVSLELPESDTAACWPTSFLRSDRYRAIHGAKDAFSPYVI